MIGSLPTTTLPGSENSDEEADKNLSWSIHDVLLEDKVLMAAHVKWSQVCNTVHYADADYFLLREIFFFFSVVGAVIYNLGSMWNFFPNSFELLKKKKKVAGLNSKWWRTLVIM